MSLLKNNNALKKVRIEDLMKKDLNLYPYKNGKLSNKAKHKRLVVLIAGAVVISLFGFCGYLFVQNAQLVGEIAVRNANLQVEYERLKNQQMLDELLKRVEYKSNLLDYIDSSNSSAILVIETIERNVPNEIQYINLDFVSDNTIRISCKTTNTEWIAKLVHQLKMENFFNDVFVESINLNKTPADPKNSTEYEFQLICTFGGQTDEAKK